MRVADAPPMTPTTASENQCALMSVRCQIMPAASTAPMIHQPGALRGRQDRRDRDEEDARADRVPRWERSVIHREQRPEESVREVFGRRGRSTRFFVSCETTTLPTISAVRKNTRRAPASHDEQPDRNEEDRQHRPRQLAEVLEDHRHAPSSPWSRPLAPTSRRQASSSGCVNGASTFWDTATPKTVNSASR